MKARFIALTLFIVPVVLHAQSGRAALHGWVAFEGVAYVDAQPTAKVELRRIPPDTTFAYGTKTDEHGFYTFDRISLGEFELRITAPGYKAYHALVYVPSDFVGNWAVILKKQ